MIQSIQAANTAIYNPTQNTLGAGKVSTGGEKTVSEAEKNEDETTSTSVQGDTLTISNQGAQMSAKALNTQSASGTAGTVISEENYTDSVAEALSSAAAGAGITEYTSGKNENSVNAAVVSSESSSDSSSSDSNLSEYSESELKQMLQNGEITQAEYNAEIASRQESDDTSSDEDSDNFAAVQ